MKKLDSPHLIGMLAVVFAAYASLIATYFFGCSIRLNYFGSYLTVPVGFSLHRPATVAVAATSITAGIAILCLCWSILLTRRPVLAIEHVFALVYLSPALLLFTYLIRLVMIYGLTYP